MASYSAKTCKKSMYWHKHRHGGGWISAAWLPGERKRAKRTTAMYDSLSELFGRKI